MSPVEIFDNRREERRLRRIGDVVDLVSLASARTKQVPLASHAARQRVSAADADHLSAARFVGSGRARDVRQVLGSSEIGHIDDRRAARLRLAGQRVHRAVRRRMVTDVCDEALVLADDDRLIRRSSLQIVPARQLHVPLRLGVAGLRRRGCGPRRFRSAGWARCLGRSVDRRLRKKEHGHRGGGERQGKTRERAIFISVHGDSSPGHPVSAEIRVRTG